jgi:Na+-transporting methylmalonyl-CoA/oxaloacetate decarboxylase gamma subunit
MQRRFKYIISGIFVLILVAVMGKTTIAQNATDFRFNEILVLNDSNYVDDFGQHSSWIEIMNSSYSNVNIGGCYLTNDLSNPTKYWIPTGDPATYVSPRGYLVFWADGKPTRGIFHLNFELEGSKVIALFDANGKTLIDKLEIPQNQIVNKSYGLVDQSTLAWDKMEFSTPGANNDHSRKASSGEKFVEMDPYGIGMTMIAMFVVFSALAILYIIYKNIGNFFVNKVAKSKKNEAVQVTDGKEPKVELSGEVNAAIAMALYMYQNEMHDFENTVLTIRKVSKNYSPWSSKIYTLRKSPR